MPDDVESQVKQIENMLLLLKQSMTNKTVENQFKKLNEGTDTFTKLMSLSLEHVDVNFLATVPDLILVLGNPHLLDQAREILKLNYDKCSQKQLLGYDTQFNLGNNDFTCLIIITLEIF